MLKTVFPILKSMKFLLITQLKYCQKSDFDSDPINKYKTLTIKTIVSDFKMK